MFERFAAESRRAALSAQRAAARAGAEAVGPEHVLLGLACEAGTPAGRAFAELGIDEAQIATAIEEDLVAMLALVGVPAAVVAATPARPRLDRPPFSRAAKRALELALREALQRGDRRIGTEHVALGVLRLEDATVTRLLERLDVDPERLAALVQLEAASAPR